MRLRLLDGGGAFGVSCLFITGSGLALLAALGTGDALARMMITLLAVGSIVASVTLAGRAIALVGPGWVRVDVLWRAVLREPQPRTLSVQTGCIGPLRSEDGELWLRISGLNVKLWGGSAEPIVQQRFARIFDEADI